MNTATRLRLKYEVDETLYSIIEASRHVDEFSPIEQEIEITAALHDAWAAQLAKAMHEVRKLGSGFLGFWSAKPMPAEVVSVLGKHLSGSALTDGTHQTISTSIGTAFVKGRESVNADFHRKSGKHPAIKDAQYSGVAFGQLLGLREDHALQALLDQLIVSAGGFWDNQLSESIKKELEGYFNGTATREDMVAKIESMVNSRLAIDGASSLPTVYFDNLATHQIVRARNVGSFYRAKALNAKHYVLVNPRDARTSPICDAVTQGQVYTMAGAEQTISGVITATSLDDLKAAAPFFKTPGEVVNPVPPLHWPKCRTWMEYTFEGLG